MNDTKERPTTCEIHIDPTMRTPLPLERPTAPIPTHVANAIGPSCRHCSPFLFARKAPRCGHHKDVALELPAITPIPEHLSHIILACRSCYPELFDTDNESNGGGALMAHVPCEGALAWHMGATFERDAERLPMTIAEQADAHMHNWQRLQALVPTAAATLRPAFAPGGDLRAWSGVRCTSQDRMPIVGPVDAAALPGLWISTAMGARGLTRAVLCAELLAARLMGEPLPVETKLARAMGTERL